MSFLGFEISIDDLENVIKKNDLDLGSFDKEDLFTLLNFGLIEKNAMYGDDLDSQTDYAYAEILRQIKLLLN